MLSVMIEVKAKCPGNAEGFLSSFEWGSVKRFHVGGGDI